MTKEYPTKPISWVTPLGFPVVQPYRHWGKCTVKTCLQRITLAYRDENASVHAGKQVLGLVPNFVHSTDACHLLMCAIRAVLEKLAFGCVHDAIWTHLEDIDRMNRIIREEFVMIHEQPLLENLREQWMEDRPGLELPMPPERGDLDLWDITESTYFFIRPQIMKSNRRSRFHPAKVFFFRSDTRMSRFVRAVTRCPWSHVAVADRDVVMDVTLADGLIYWPRFAWEKPAGADQIKSVSLGQLPLRLWKYQGQESPTKWKVVVKYVSLGLFRYQGDCVGTTIHALEQVGMEQFPRGITSPKALLRELEKRGYS